MKKLDFVFFEAGGGHRSAALALQEIAQQQRRDWDIRLVNLQEVLDPLDIFRKCTGVRLQDVYNLVLKHGFTLGSHVQLRLVHGIIRRYHRQQIELLQNFWRGSEPDLVVSLIPNFNRALFQALRQAAPAAPLVTVLTDLADYPPHFWIERQPQYFICGTAKAAEQARAMGHDASRVFCTSGMILRPKFYEPVDVDRRSERERLGLDPQLPTGLVLFGGEGSKWMVGIARRLSESGIKLQLILICGRNARLREKIRNLKLSFPARVEGFTSQIPYYMHLSDFFIGKPGPGSISEALAMKLPVIVERNAWTMVQERYNADWIRENEVGIVLASFRQIVEGTRRLLEPQTFERLRANAALIRNRAVFEIPELLDGLLRQRKSLSELTALPR